MSAWLTCHAAAKELDWLKRNVVSAWLTCHAAAKELDWLKWNGGVCMVVSRPAIMIYVREPDVDFLREVCAGIEEEGVPFQVKTHEGDLDTLAYEAAAESMLGSGIGICGARLAMQMQRVPRGRNLFELDTPTFRQCRNLGANSARALKRLPFKLNA